MLYLGSEEKNEKIGTKSIYSRDYVLIKQAELEKDRSALKELGFQEK
jgi:hypothetical protein